MVKCKALIEWGTYFTCVGALFLYDTGSIVYSDKWSREGIGNGSST